jgi:hypothetical protein
MGRRKAKSVIRTSPEWEMLARFSWKREGGRKRGREGGSEGKEGKGVKGECYQSR